MGTNRDRVITALDSLKASTARINEDIRDLGNDAILVTMSRREFEDRITRIRRDLDNHFVAIWREKREFGSDA